MDKYLKVALRGAVNKLAQFVADNFILLFLGVCLIGLVVIAGYWNWDFWGETTYHDGKLVELRVDRGRVIQQSLFVVGGFVALFLAMWRTWTAKLQADASLQQVRIAQKGQNTDRYVKAVEMLSTDSAIGRRSALLALKEIAILDFPNSYLLVRQTLQAFIQEASDYCWNHEEDDDAAVRARATDIADAFAIFGQLKASYDPLGQYLSGLTEYPYIRIDNIYLTKAACVFTDYTGCHFRGGKFDECQLIHSILTGVQFENCTFSNTLANYSDFARVRFRECTFKATESDFRQAFLEGAVFENVRFEDRGRIYISDISSADFTACPELVPDNIVDCAAYSDKPPEFPSGVDIEYRKIDVQERAKARVDPSLEGKWFAWSKALKVFPREEAIQRARALGIADWYFLYAAFGEFEPIRRW
jgi:Pentapeptide repeats (9 copies)